MEEQPHAPVRKISLNDFGDPQQGTVKLVHIFPTCILSGSKTNMTTIHAIISNSISGKMNLLNQTQANQTTHTIALLFN
jgi:hypothetical protein